MTRQHQLGIMWSAAETVNVIFPYGNMNSGTTLPTLASNVADFTYNGTYLQCVNANMFQNAPTILSTGNLVMILKVGTQYWGGAVGDTEYFYFGHGTGLKFKLSDTTGGAEKWVIDVTNNAGTSVGTGTTQFSCASSANVNYISVLREATRVRVWVNGVKEVDASGISSTAWDAATITYLGGPQNAHAGKHMYIGQILRMSTDTADDYLDPTGFASAAVLVTTGAGAYNDGPWGAQAPIGSAGGTIDGNIDDWNSGVADGDATVVVDVGTAGNTYRLYRTTATPTCANLVGVNVFAVGKGGVAAKATTGILGLGDGTNKVEAGSLTITGTAYVCSNASFPTAPDGGSWGSFTLANLELGFRHDVGASADICALTALGAELFGCTFLSDGRPSLAMPNPARKFAHLVGR